MAASPRSRPPAFDALAEKIAAHSRFGPEVARAAAERAPLVLNYHAHAPGHPWCVSLCARERNPLPLLGQPEPLRELAHVREFGRSADECVPLCSYLGAALRDRFGLDAPPDIYLDGRPYPASPPAGGR